MLDDLFKFLAQNFIFVLIALGWIVSSLGGLMQTAARNAERRRRELESKGHAVPRTRDQHQTASPAGGGGQAGSRRSGGAAGQGTGRGSQRPSADEIAAEIRRVMGLEEEPAPSPSASPRRPQRGHVPVDRGGFSDDEMLSGQQAALAEDVNPYATGPERAESLPVPVVPDRPRRSLRDALAESAGDGVVGQRDVAALQAAAVGRRRVRGRRRRGAGPLVDLRDPVQAIVLAEILGKPRAEQPFVRDE